MKVAVGSDERTALTDAVIASLRRRGVDADLSGPLAGEELAWPDVAQRVAEAVSQGLCQEGILFCWTGTGVSMAANKVPGIRAALCSDAETARGARRWNHANILVMSLRATSPAVAEEILDAWFSTPFGLGDDEANVAKVQALEAKYKPHLRAALSEVIRTASES